jgi:hypothetical protein
MSIRSELLLFAQRTQTLSDNQGLILRSFKMIPEISED